MRQIVQKELGDSLSRQGEPRFQFLERFNKASVDAPGNVAKTPTAASEDAPVRFIYSYAAVFGDPLADPRSDPYPDGLLERLSAMGINGVWMHVVLRDLAPGGKDFPEFGEGCEKTSGEPKSSCATGKAIRRQHLSLHERAAIDAGCVL